MRLWRVESSNLAAPHSQKRVRDRERGEERGRRDTFRGFIFHEDADETSLEQWREAQGGVVGGGDSHWESRGCVCSNDEVRWMDGREGGEGRVMEEERGRVLGEVEVIAAEDTRHSEGMLKRLGLEGRPVVALHQHSSESVRRGLLERLEEGQKVALICDAGTPLISDPGAELVSEAWERKIRITPVPGPNAMVTALSGSGEEFVRAPVVFVGFLPRKNGDRRAKLEPFAKAFCTLAIYENANRLEELMKELATELGGDRWVLVARELTKQFETIDRVKLKDAAEFVATKVVLKGEFTILVSAPLVTVQEEKKPLGDEQLDNLVDILKEEGLSAKQGAVICSRFFKLPKTATYDYVRQRFSESEGNKQ